MQCNSKFKGEHKCETPHLDEETIKARFVTALNAITESKDNILEDCRLMQATLTDCTGIDTEIKSLFEEIDVATELKKRCIAENSQTAQNQEEYAARYNGFVERYEKAKARLEQLRTTKLHGKPRQKPSELSCSRCRSWTPSTSLRKNSG